MSAIRWSVAGLAGALLVLPLLRDGTRAARPTGLLGPLAELAAELEWVRFEGALSRGDEARALALAEHALTLAPRSTSAWLRLAAHQGYDLASPNLEPELARRRAWFEACLATVARGRALAAEPAELELFLATYLFDRAARDPELVPGGKEQLEAGALAALEAAAAHGSELAREVLAQRAPATPAR